MYAPQYTRLYILSACLCKKNFHTFKDTDTVTALKTNLAGGGSVQCSSDGDLRDYNVDSTQLKSILLNKSTL